MFGLGIWELLILVVLLAWLFRRTIQRRFPRAGRHVNMVLLITLVLVILYDLATLLR